MPEIDFNLPDYAAKLLDPYRYKVLWGGRGSAKSYTVTRVLLSIGMQRPCRVLCGREFQNSMADSVHHLLASQIDECGLSSFYDVQQQRILGTNGTEFIFKGVRHNIQSIKSLAKITHLWLEEAQTVSAESWAVLIPTIREPGSEIWATFNPDLESDPTYQKFVVNEPPPNSLVMRVNWERNPWFPAELDAERRYLQRADPDAYAHIWGGHCRSRSDAQVLKGKVRVEAFAPGAGWDGPYYGADWGFAEDPTALVRLWVHDRSLYVEHEVWGVGVEIDHLPAFFDRVPGSRQHVIRADSARPETISYMQRNGFKMIGAKKGAGSVEDGVAHLRGYESIVVHPRCTHTTEEFRLWSYKTDRLTGDVLPVLDHPHSHVPDACRYAMEPMIRRRQSQIQAVMVAGL